MLRYLDKLWPAHNGLYKDQYKAQILQSDAVQVIWIELKVKKWGQKGEGEPVGSTACMNGQPQRHLENKLGFLEEL